MHLLTSSEIERFKEKGVEVIFGKAPGDGNFYHRGSKSQYQKTLIAISGTTGLLSGNQVVANAEAVYYQYTSKVAWCASFVLERAHGIVAIDCSLTSSGSLFYQKHAAY